MHAFVDGWMSCVRACVCAMGGEALAQISRNHDCNTWTINEGVQYSIAAMCVRACARARGRV